MDSSQVQNAYKQQESSRSRVYQGVDEPNLVAQNRDKSTDRVLQSGKSKGSVSGSQSYYQQSVRGNTVNLPRSTNYSINENSANSQKRIEAEQRQKKSNSQYVNISNVTVIEQQRQFRSSHKGPESDSYVKSPFVKGGQKNMSNQSLQNKLTTDYKNHSLYQQEAS